MFTVDWQLDGSGILQVEEGEVVLISFLDLCMNELSLFFFPGEVNFEAMTSILTDWYISPHPFTFLLHFDAVPSLEILEKGQKKKEVRDFTPSFSRNKVFPW